MAAATSGVWFLIFYHSLLGSYKNRVFLQQKLCQRQQGSKLFDSPSFGPYIHPLLPNRGARRLCCKLHTMARTRIPRRRGRSQFELYVDRHDGGAPNQNQDPQQVVVVEDEENVAKRPRTVTSVPPPTLDFMERRRLASRLPLLFLFLTVLSTDQYNARQRRALPMRRRRHRQELVLRHGLHWQVRRCHHSSHGHGRPGGGQGEGLPDHGGHV